MKSVFIKNIGLLVGATDHLLTHKRGKEISAIPTLADAWLLAVNGRIVKWGSMESQLEIPDNAEIVDANKGTLLPSFCDSHTHIVYAGSREHEFIDKIRGLSYEEIARRGGGILNSAELLHNTSENELYRQSMVRAKEIMYKGTACVEIKTGYGLLLEDELKMLRVIARVKESMPITVRATLLAAHAIPLVYKGHRKEYVDYVISEMIPAIAAEGIASFIDVFCDEGFFTPDDTRRILETGGRFGLRPKIHANELAQSGGVQVGIANNALSVDHLERAETPELELLGKNNTVATMLPGTSFFLGIPYGNAREAIDRGAILALASDYNPGSSPSGDMRMVMSLGCIRMKLTPAEAINATTINGAYAMGEADRHGSITPGKYADFIITEELPSLDFFPYAYTTPLIKQIWVKGERQL